MFVVWAYLSPSPASQGFCSLDLFSLLLSVMDF